MVTSPHRSEYGIAQIVVDDGLLIEVNLDADRAGFIRDRVFIPIDELLGYIVHRHFAESEERRRIHASVRDIRKRWTEFARAYEATIGQVGTLYLVCKNPQRRARLKTFHQAVEGQEVICPACDVTCPACGSTDSYDGSDLRWGPTGQFEERAQ